MEQSYLNFNQTNDLVTRLPSFELSYETISHKKVSDYYDITLAIPYGKKCQICWFQFIGLLVPIWRVANIQKASKIINKT